MEQQHDQTLTNTDQSIHASMRNANDFPTVERQENENDFSETIFNDFDAREFEFVSILMLAP